MPDESIIIPIEIIEQEAIKSLKNLDTATSTVVAKMQRAFNLKLDSNVPEELKKSEAAFNKLEATVNATIANINKKLESISGTSKFNFTANATDVDKVIAQINVLQKELKDLQTASINPNISTAQLAVFNEQIENTKIKIDALKASSNIVIAVDSLQMNQAIAMADILESDLLGLKKLVVDPAINPQQLLALNTIIENTETKLTELKSTAGIVITADGSQVLKTVSQIRDELGKTKISTPVKVTVSSNVPQVMKQSETSVKSLAVVVSEATERINAGIDKMAADALRVPDAFKKSEAGVKAFAINSGNALAFFNKQANQFTPGRGLDQFIAKGKQVEQAMQRLNPASNQASFALTNFGRIAQDLPFGLIGVANNITPLVESLQRLSAQAKETGTSVGKQLLNSLKGGGGLILGVSLLTSVMQFAAIGFSAFTRGFDGAGKAAGEAAIDIRKAHQIIADGAASVQGDIANINALLHAYSDTSSLEKQKRILSELTNINENYFGKLKAGVSTFNEISAAANQYTEALIANAVVKGFTDEISKVSSELAKAKKGYREAAIASSDYNEQLKKIRDPQARERQRSTGKPTLELEKQLNAVVALQEEFNRLQGEIQTAVGETFKFKPIEGDPLPDDKTDATIARAKQFVKEFGDIFVVPDLEESFFKKKPDILKAAQKLLDDVSNGKLTMKLPAVDFTALESEVPFEPKVDPNFKFDEGGKIRAGMLQQMEEEFQEPLVIDPTINVAVFNEKIQGQLDKALKAGDFKGALDLIDTDKSNAVFDGLDERVKTSAGLVNDTLTPAFQGMFDAIIKGENPLKAFFKGIIQAITQVIQRLIAAAIQALILKAISGGSGGSSGGLGSLIGKLGTGAANFGQRVGFAGGGAGVANVSVTGVLRGTDIYLSGVGGGRSIGRAGG